MKFAFAFSRLVLVGSVVSSAAPTKSNSAAVNNKKLESPMNFNLEFLLNNLDSIEGAADSDEQSGSKIRRLLNGDSDVKIPYIPKSLSKFALTYVVTNGKSMLASAIDSGVKKQRLRTADNEIIVKTMSTFLDGNEVPIGNFFNRTNQILNEDQDTKLNMVALFNFTDPALNGEIMEYSSEIMRALSKKSPSVGTALIKNLSALQEKQHLFQEGTFKRFLGKVKAPVDKP